MMKRHSSQRRPVSVAEGNPVIVGLETGVAEAAVSAAIRVLTPARRYIVASLERSGLQKELAQLPASSEISQFLESLTPEVAAEVVRFLSSGEMRTLAFN